MSKIVQFSSIGALMAGCFRGELLFTEALANNNFGLGCSAGINGELTVIDGVAYEASADEVIRQLPTVEKIPFVQLTDFQPQESHSVENITLKNAYELISQYIKADNVFLAIAIKGIFDNVKIRRPHRDSNIDREVSEVANNEEINEIKSTKGTLVGFWTPELFGRVAVPGFHFHFISEDKKISGHVLEFLVKEAILSFEEKSTIEVTNPTSEYYKTKKIDVSALDAIIERVEKQS